MTKRFLLYFFMTLASFLVVKSQTGRESYDFLDIPTSSHVYGLGGTNVSLISEDVTLADQNPALIGPELDKVLAVSYMHWLGASNFASAKYGMGAGEHGAWAFGIRYLNYGEIQGYDPSGSYTGSFTPSDIIFEGTYSHDFTYRLRGGINVKMVYSNYEQYTAWALAADLGLSYYDDDHDLSVGFVLKNMGGQIKRFQETYDHLPFDIQLGLTKGLGSQFSFSVTAFRLTRWRETYYDHSDDETTVVVKTPGFGRNLFRHLIFGIQYEPTDNFYIDLAYNYRVRTDMSSYQRNFLSGFSAGLGLNVRAFDFGVAYAMPHKGASTILLNIGLDIGYFL